MAQQRDNRRIAVIAGTVGLVVLLGLWVVFGVGFVNALFLGLGVVIVTAVLLLVAEERRRLAALREGQPRSSPPANAAGAAAAQRPRRPAEAAPGTASAGAAGAAAPPFGAAVQAEHDDRPSEDSDRSIGPGEEPSASQEPGDTAAAPEPSGIGDAASGAPADVSAEPADHRAGADALGVEERDRPEAGGDAAAAEPATAGVRPEALPGPRDGQADDLKRIRGIGPKIEDQLNDAGIYHFDQISGWSEDEIAWIDQHVGGFAGRVRREDWVGQARALAADPGPQGAA